MGNKWVRVIGFTLVILLVSPFFLVVRYLNFVSDGWYEKIIDELWEEK